MSELRAKFQCHHKACKHAPPSEVVLKLDGAVTAGTGKKQIVVYCNQNHENIVEVPANAGRAPLVLGPDIIHYDNQVPVFQGKDPFNAGS